MASTSDFELHVKGEAAILLPPERAVLSAKVFAEGTDKRRVTEVVIAACRKVEAILRGISVSAQTKDAAVDYWSRTSLNESSHQPAATRHGDEMKEHPRRYSARVNFDVRLQKFNKLGSLIGELVAIDYVQNEGVEWILTPATSDAQRSQLRTMAAQDARQKASEYACALGYKSVHALTLKEGHSYARSSSRKGGMMPMSDTETQAKNMADAEGWEDVSEEAFLYTPEEVKMTQTVDATFRAE